jgi:putative ABC transport system substrate-binding protein
MASLWAAALLALPGCFNRGAPAITAKPVKLARTQKLAVIRLGDPTIGHEPPDADIAAGLKYAGLDDASFDLASFDAKGDLAAVPSLLGAAARDRADLLFTLLPETTVAAAGKNLKIPLVFQMTGEPLALGLGKNDADHQQNLTGAYTPFHESLTVPIARGCLPKARKLGILFNPDNRFSVIHKDAILRTNWGGLEPVTAEFHSDREVPAAVKTLIEKKAQAVILVSGIGAAAKAVIEEAKRAKVPVFGFLAEHAKAGAIVAREPTMRWGGFEAGRRAGRVLRGEPAGQIPFIQGVDYITYVNTDAAKDLGVTILAALLRNARVVSAK